MIEQPQELTIARLIAHVLHERAGGRALTLSDMESPLSEDLATFFARHVRAAMADVASHHARFEGDHPVRRVCAQMQQDPASFVPASRAIAEHLFPAVQQDRRISLGHLIVCICTADPPYDGLVALFKMDTVEAFSCQPRARGNRTVVEIHYRGPVILEAAAQRSAMRRRFQKCALVLPPDAAEQLRCDLIVLDYQVSGVASFWSDLFLRCRYVLSPIEATETLYRQTRRWIALQADRLDPEEAGRLLESERLALQREEPVRFPDLAEVLSEDDRRAEYLSFLQQSGLEEEGFVPDVDRGKELVQDVGYRAEGGIVVRGPADRLAEQVQVDREDVDAEGRFLVTLRTRAWNLARV